MTEHQRDVEQLLRSLTRFVRVLQEQHVASTQVNEKLRKKTLVLLRQLNHARASTFAGLAASRRTIDVMQARLAEEKQQPPTLLATPSSATKVTSEVNKRSEAPDENNGAWISSTKFMAVIRERNRIQQQLSSTLSAVSNMQHRDVVAGAEAPEQSLRLTRTRHTEQHEALEESSERAASAERRLASNQKQQYELTLELESYQVKLRAKDRLVEQSRRENLSLQHRCKDNAAEILTLNEALLFAQTKNDELRDSSQEMQAQWKEMVRNMEKRSKKRAGTFDRTDRFMAETKIQLLERELEMLRGSGNMNTNSSNTSMHRSDAHEKGGVHTAATHSTRYSHIGTVEKL